MDSKGLDQVFELLAEPDVAVKVAAAEALCQITSGSWLRRAFVELLALLRHHDGTMRRAAAEALGRLQKRGARAFGGDIRKPTVVTVQELTRGESSE